MSSIKGIIPSQLLVYRLFRNLPFGSIYIDKTKVDRVNLTLQQNKNTVSCIFSPIHLFRHFKTNKENYTFSPRIARILMCRYCVHVHQ